MDDSGFWHNMLRVLHLCTCIGEQLMRMMRPMAQDQDTPDELLTERVIFPVSKAMLQAITDYRFENRIDSKSEALRRLVEAGLKAESKRLRK